jgi:hypothetical protein
MTTAEHLTRIRNLFAKVEEMEKMATMERWASTVDTEYPFYELWSEGQSQYLGSLMCEEDASFIALNRNIIVPLVKMGKVHLNSLVTKRDELLTLHEAYAEQAAIACEMGVSEWEAFMPKKYHALYAELDEILTLFPDELLTLCGV